MSQIHAEVSVHTPHAWRIIHPLVAALPVFTCQLMKSGRTLCTLLVHNVRVLQCVAMCCNVLQCVAACSRVLICVAVCCSAMQCVAVCCSVLQCVAVCCSALFSSTTYKCCSVLQCVAVCCSVLQLIHQLVAALAVCICASMCP